jgi:hypothetical protein
MRTPRRLLTLAVVLALPLAMMATASAAPDCRPEGKHFGSPACANGEDPPPEENQNKNCADLEWANDPEDTTLSMSAADGDDCEDIEFVPNGSTFNFTFTVEPDGQVITSPWMLRIRNSVPGDGCSGYWKYYDGDPEDDGTVVLIEGLAPTGINPRVVGDGYTATMVVQETFDEDTGNCTTPNGDVNEVNWADEDAGSWVITLARSAGKPLQGDQFLTVNWTITLP